MHCITIYNLNAEQKCSDKFLVWFQVGLLGFCFFFFPCLIDHLALYHPFFTVYLYKHLPVNKVSDETDYCLSQQRYTRKRELTYACYCIKVSIFIRDNGTIKSRKAQPSAEVHMLLIKYIEDAM